MFVRMALVFSFTCLAVAACALTCAGRELPGVDLESGFIEVDGGRVFYEAAGQGPHMVLIHDGLVHREVWDGQIPFFARDHRVIIYDRRGYGRSPAPEAPYDDMEDLKTVFEYLEVPSATLVGMSAGGRLAIDFTLKYPEKVSALVLVGAVLSGYGFSPHFYTRGGRLSIADYSDTEKMREYWASEDPYEIAPENAAARKRLKELLEANPQNVDLGRARLVKPPERAAVDHLDEIAVPALVIVGESDIADVHAHAGAIEAGIAGAQRSVVTNAAHLVPFERPDEFNAQVSVFLKESAFLEIFETRGTEAAVAAIEEARSRDPDAVLFREAKINQMGYLELRAGNVDRAIGLFRINMVAFPGSWNAYDSLAEAYATKGLKDLAIENYERSLEMNPDNANARAWLERLRQE
jgi:3-oxoadipate enol-lactonase